jgi:hypothetical protein
MTGSFKETVMSIQGARLYRQCFIQDTAERLFAVSAIVGDDDLDSHCNVLYPATLLSR